MTMLGNYFDILDGAEKDKVVLDKGRTRGIQFKFVDSMEKKNIYCKNIMFHLRNTVNSIENYPFHAKTIQKIRGGSRSK